MTAGDIEAVVTKLGKRDADAPLAFSFFIQAGTPGCYHTRDEWVFPPQSKPPWQYPRRHTRVSLLGDPKSNHVDREDDSKVFQKDIMVPNMHTDLNLQYHPVLLYS